jgi:hypothetical protein
MRGCTTPRSGSSAREASPRRASRPRVRPRSTNPRGFGDRPAETTRIRQDDGAFENRRARLRGQASTPFFEHSASCPMDDHVLGSRRPHLSPSMNLIFGGGRGLPRVRTSSSLEQADLVLGAARPRPPGSAVTSWAQDDLVVSTSRLHAPDKDPMSCPRRVLVHPSRRPRPTSGILSYSPREGEVLPLACPQARPKTTSLFGIPSSCSAEDDLIFLGSCPRAPEGRRWLPPTTMRAMDEDARVLASAVVSLGLSPCYKSLTDALPHPLCSDVNNPGGGPWHSSMGRSTQDLS